MPPDVGATYRVQLHKDFTLDDAAALAGYLADLGISHLYCSPYLQARPGSTHGYDVVDHSRINEELGGAEALDRLVEALAAHGMGHILDMVPNHMTITERANAWWWDVLKHGPRSEYAPFFDINWDPAEERLRHNILLPILGDHYGRILDKGEIRLDIENGEPIVGYYEHVLPVAPASMAHALGEDGDLEGRVRRANEDPDLLHELLELQYYRLAYWKVAGKELNYRRFFAINDLAALRMENPQVFEAVHRLVLELVRAGKLDGLRIDHIDGLRYPTGYLRKLRDAAEDAYIVVEKILEPDEELPREWPIEGTTGYDFLDRVGYLFVDPEGSEPMTDVYARFTREPVGLEDSKRAKKMQLIDTEFGGEFERLTDLFVEVCESHRQYRDYPRSELREALRETAASFPVYRTYAEPGLEPRPDDKRYVEAAISAARAARPDLEGDLFDLLTEILLLRVSGPAAEALGVRFQQTTGPVVAKGIEDTLFYTYNRLISLNEVGGDPARFGIGLEDFHESNRRTLERWPRTMLASSTHDTKRSEDARARISLLSEIPAMWAQRVERWAEMNAKHKRNDLPDPNTEYLLYQTLVGAWPLGVRRAEVFMQKAVREAKVRTSWIAPDPTYEAGVRGFVERVMGDREFEDDLDDFMRYLVVPGWVGALSQLLIKLTAPGVPDIYQGSETWNYSLVDPDNRRQVDYKARRRLLDQVNEMTGAEAWAARELGAPKMYLTKKALGLRRELPRAFGPEGSYEPLYASGPHSRRVVAFVRAGAVIAIAPRLGMGVQGGWEGTTLELPPGSWRDVLTEATRSDRADLDDLLDDFPVALLVKENP